MPFQASGGTPAVDVSHSGEGPAITIRHTGTGPAIRVVRADGTAFEIDSDGEVSPVGPQIQPYPRSARPLVNTSGKIITSFASGHGFFSSLAGTATANVNDTSDQIMSDRCVTVTTGGDGGNNFIKGNSLTAFDSTGKFVRVRVKLPASGTANIATLSVFLSTDNVVANYYSGDLAGPNSTWPDWAGGDGGWQGITLPWGSMGTTGAPTRAGLNSCWLKVADKNGVPITVKFGGVELLPDPTAGAVSITFDDGFLSQWTQARAKMAQYRFPGTAYIIRDVIGTSNYMTLQNLKDLQEIGWDIASHASTVANHNLAGGFTDLAPKDVEAEFRGIKGWLVRNGFRAGAHWAMPRGMHNGVTRDKAKMHFSSARGTFGPNKETWPPADFQKLRVLYATDSMPTSTFASEVTNAINNKTWLILVFHDIVASPAASSTDYSITNFGTVIDNIASSGLAVRTISDVIENGL